MRQVRINTVARSIMHCLRNPQATSISCLAFLVSTPAFAATAGVFPRSAQKSVDTEVQLAAMQILASVWKGGLWDCPAHSMWIALSMLPTAEEQASCITAMNVAIFYDDKRKESGMKRPENTTLAPDILSKLEMNLASLEQSLLDKDPLMPQHLRAIHSTLITYPESVHLLHDSEIAKLIQAAQVHTKTQIVKEAAKGTGGSATRRKSVSKEDL